MAFFNGHKLEQNENGYIVTLYVDEHMTEFADELLRGSKGELDSLGDNIQRYISEKLPDLKIAAIRLMVGTLLVATIPFGTSEIQTVEAATTDTVQQAYTTYKVVSGDSLWTISRKFNVTVDAIKSLNGMTGDTIYPDQTLKIPSSAAPQTSTVSNYTVAAGDSLWIISRKFNTTVDGLKLLNGLTADTILVGQVLKVPGTIAAPAPVPSPTPTPTPAPTQPYVTYTSHTVVSGENGWTISLKYGIPMTELLKVNNLTQSSVLKIGQVLKIPVHIVPVMQTPGAKYGENLDWWTGAQYVFPIGKVAKVTDFKTGKTFMIKRTIGANHADCEPLTAADAAVVKSIWGGSYSWTPRAVIVEVDGRRLAASMSSMPHDVQYITDNGFNGHFDLHFRNSTRHKDGLVDPAHQAQIKIAAGVTGI